mgnify:CR=1 FL=1
MMEFKRLLKPNKVTIYISKNFNINIQADTMAEKHYTFMGDTPAQALKKAQETLGDDIMLVENKEIRKKSLTQSNLYEIVVKVDDESIESNKNKNKMKLKHIAIVCKKDLMKLQKKKWQKSAKKRKNPRFMMKLPYSFLMQ